MWGLVYRFHCWPNNHSLFANQLKPILLLLLQLSNFFYCKLLHCQNPTFQTVSVLHNLPDWKYPFSVCVYPVLWESFQEGLRDRLERGPEMNMLDEAGLGLAVHWVHQVLILAYEDNCPLRFVKTGRQSLRWISELESLRRGVRRLFNKCRADNNLQNWELYREAQRRYRKEGGMNGFQRDLQDLL